MGGLGLACCECRANAVTVSLLFRLSFGRGFFDDCFARFVANVHAKGNGATGTKFAYANIVRVAVRGSVSSRRKPGVASATICRRRSPVSSRRKPGVRFVGAIATAKRRAAMFVRRFGEWLGAWGVACSLYGTYRADDTTWWDGWLCVMECC